MKSSESPGVPNTFSGRIKGAMSQAGLDPEPKVLVKAWAKKYGAKHKISRTSVYKWFKAKNPKIDIPNLFYLSDLLDVNARWLALGAPYSPAKPISPDPELKMLLDAYQTISPEAKRELVAEGNKLLRVHKAATRNTPFPQT
jgi:hypothetical protein